MVIDELCVADGVVVFGYLLVEQRLVDEHVQGLLMQLLLVDQLGPEGLAVDLLHALVLVLVGALVVARRDGVAVHRGDGVVAGSGEIGIDAPQGEGR